MSDGRDHHGRRSRPRGPLFRAGQPDPDAGVVIELDTYVGTLSDLVDAVRRCAVGVLTIEARAVTTQVLD